MKEQIKYWTPDEILKYDADINMIFGQKGNGKTTGCLEWLIQDFLKNDSEFAIERRWSDDFTGARAKSFFSDIVARGKITEWTNGEWTGVTYYQKAWYLSRYDAAKDKTIKMKRPMAYARSLSAYEHDNGNQYPYLYNVLFDEFLTTHELKDEFVYFWKMYSNMRRDKTDKPFRVFMCGNTVSYSSCYWDNFNINALELKPGTFTIFDDVTDEGKPIKVVCEYCANTASTEANGIISVFARNNPKLKMIVDGEFEVGAYARPVEYKSKDVIFNFYIRYNDNKYFICKVINTDLNLFLFIDELDDIDKIDFEEDIIYSNEISMAWNIRNKFFDTTDELGKLITRLFNQKKVAYNNNITGNLIETFIENNQKL